MTKATHSQHYDRTVFAFPSYHQKGKRMENKEQELFEQWAARNGHDLERRKTTTRTTHPYFSAVTNTAWEAWQARAKLNNQ